MKREINTSKLNRLIRDFKEKYPTMDYFTLDEIVQLMDMAFCLGYDAGTDRNNRRVKRSDGHIYNSVVEAGNVNGVCHQSIRDAIKYNRRSAGYTWEYLKT
jgi:hypothetical protein